MKKIPLTQSQETLVDDEDYEYLMQWKWQAAWSPGVKGFYVVRPQLKDEYTTRAERKQVKMHRVITNAPNGKHVDHINGNTLDNRRINLRIVTARENALNKHTTSSKYPGVTWDVNMQKWGVQIVKDKVTYKLGYFSNEKTAAEHFELANEGYKRGCTFLKRGDLKKSSKYLGVRHSYKSWQAAINKNGKYYYLGSFDSEIDASKAYNKAKKELKLGNEPPRYINPNNTSRFKGVSYNKSTKKWQANININKKRIYLGSFKTEEEAYNAVLKGREEHETR